MEDVDTSAQQRGPEPVVVGSVVEELVGAGGADGQRAVRGPVRHAVDIDTRALVIRERVVGWRGDVDEVVPRVGRAEAVAALVGAEVGVGEGPAGRVPQGHGQVSSRREGVAEPPLEMPTPQRLGAGAVEGDGHHARSDRDGAHGLGVDRAGQGRASLASRPRPGYRFFLAYEAVEG